ncbi:MAG: ankyrin repeat domain-containing protein, partial [Steroidobacteraceae bacterium]
MARSDLTARAALLLLLLLARNAVVQGAADPPGDALEPVRLALRQKQFTDAFARLETLAKAGNVQAAYRLGALLLANPLGEPDVPAATRWLNQAAAAGSARAAYLLAVLAATAVPADDAQARRWLADAAQAGFEPAAVLLRQNRLPLEFLPAEDLDEAQSRDAAWLRAARLDDVPTLQRLAGGAAAGPADEFGRNALMLAAAADATEAVGWLLRNGAAIEGRDSSGATALMLAARAPRALTLEALLQAGASVNAVDAAGNTALHAACLHPDALGVQRLLAARAAPNSDNKDG